MIKSPILNVIDNACRKACKFLLRDYFELAELQSSVRSNSNFIERSRRKILESLVYELSLKKGDCPIKVINLDNELETIYQASGNLSFIINPLEGMKNFERANPFFSVVISVEDNNTKETLISYVYAPAFGYCYFVAKGGGAWVENLLDHSNRARRMRVAQNNNDSSYLCLQDFVDNDNVFTDKLRVISSSSIAACMLSAGQVNKICLKHFDYASHIAGKLMILEAGGVVLDSENFVAISNSKNS